MYLRGLGKTQGPPILPEDCTNRKVQTLLSLPSSHDHGIMTVSILTVTNINFGLRKGTTSVGKCPFS